MNETVITRRSKADISSLMDQVLEGISSDLEIRLRKALLDPTARFMEVVPGSGGEKEDRRRALRDLRERLAKAIPLEVVVTLIPKLVRDILGELPED